MEYRLLFELASIGNAQFDYSTGRFRRVNRQFCAITGYTMEELLGMSPWELTHPDDLEADRVAFARITDGEADSYRAEKRYLRKDGTIVYVEVTSAIVRDEDGRAAYAVSSIQDISERKRTEAALRASEERFAKAFHCSPQPMSITTLEDGRYLHLNESFARLVGYTREELIGKTAFEIGLWQGDDRERLVHKLGAEGRITGEEHRFRTRAGEERIVVISAEVIPVDGKRCILGVAEEVTERVRAEEALREREQAFRALANSIPQLAWMKDADGWTFWYNDRWYEYTGTTFEQMQGWGWQRVHHPDHVERASASLKQALQTGVPWEETFPLRGRDGTYRWFLTRAMPIRDDAGRIVRWFGTNTDITERREVEQALRESQQFTRRVLDSLFVFVGVLELDGTVVEANRAPLEAADLTLDDVRGRKFWDCYWWSYDEGVQARLRQACARAVGGETSRYDVLVRVRGGRLMPIDFTISPLYDSEGRITHLIPSAVDITDRTVTEQALRESEERFRGTFENAAVALAHVALDGQWLRVNENLCQMVGYTREELLARTFQDITHPDDLQADLRYVQQMLAGEIRTYAMEKRYIRKDGRVVWVNLTVSLERKPSGEPDYFISVIEDITARKESEAALRESEERLRVAVQNAAFVPAQTDRELRYRWIYNAHPDFEASAVIGKRDDELEDSEGARRLVALKQRVLTTERGAREEITFERSDGPRCYDFVAEPLRDADGAVVGVTTAAFDVTDRRRAEEERRRSEAALRELNETLERRVAARTAELERRNQELQQFAYVASHDLQEPLRKVQAFASLLREDQGERLDENGHFYVSRMQEAAARMSQLLTDLLDFSRVATRGKPFRPVNVRDVVREVLGDLDLFVARTDAQVTIEADATVEADREQLRQLLNHLCLNALKFRREGVRPHIGIKTAILAPAPGAPPVCRIVVEDNGIGFEQKYAERIFQPFQRLHGRSAYEGTGMGLALCRRIVERHHGTITAESTPGAGSRFIVELPLQHVDAGPA